MRRLIRIIALFFFIVVISIFSYAQWNTIEFGNDSNRCRAFEPTGIRYLVVHDPLATIGIDQRKIWDRQASEYFVLPYYVDSSIAGIPYTDFFLPWWLILGLVIALFLIVWFKTRPPPKNLGFPVVAVPVQQPSP